MRKQKLLGLLVLLAAFQLTGCGGSDKKNEDKKVEATKAPAVEPDVENVDPEENVSDIRAGLDASTAVEEENKKSGIRSETYEGYTYANYTGTMTFYYEDQTLLYYKWFISESDKAVAETAYDNLCAHFTAMYGDGTVTDAASSDMYTTSWKTEERSVTVQNLKTGNSYEISCTVTE